MDYKLIGYLIRDAYYSNENDIMDEDLKGNGGQRRRPFTEHADESWPVGREETEQKLKDEHVTP
jgi:hypothetical protein